jgi:hypothetical protein
MRISVFIVAVALGMTPLSAFAKVHPHAGVRTVKVKKNKYKPSKSKIKIKKHSPVN